MRVSFAKTAILEYLKWQTQDKKTAKRINQLIQAIMRHPFEGIGKPEPLKHEFAGYWSRRIDDKNRLIYQITNEGDLMIVKCTGHY